MSLRSFYARGAADALGMGTAELYDVERIIKEDGAFGASRPGPGGGVPETADNIATLLIALGTGAQKRGAGRRALAFGSLTRHRVLGGDQVPDTHSWTGTESLHDVLSVLLSDPKKAQGLTSIEFDLCGLGIILRWKLAVDGKDVEKAEIFGGRGNDTPVDPLREIRVFTGDCIRGLGLLLTQ